MGGFLGSGEDHQAKTTGIANGAVIGGRFVEFSAEPNIYTPSTGSGDDASGVNLFDQNDGEVMTINMQGPTEVEAGAAIVAGALVMTDATGRAITATGSGAFVLGRAETATGGAAELMVVDLFKTGYPLP